MLFHSIYCFLNSFRYSNNFAFVAKFESTLFRYQTLTFVYIIILILILSLIHIGVFSIADISF
jgi:hypothetical protein